MPAARMHRPNICPQHSRQGAKAKVWSIPLSKEDVKRPITPSLASPTNYISLSAERDTGRPHTCRDDSFEEWMVRFHIKRHVDACHMPLLTSSSLIQLLSQRCHLALVEGKVIWLTPRTQTWGQMGDGSLYWSALLIWLVHFQSIKVPQLWATASVCRFVKLVF